MQRRMTYAREIERRKDKHADAQGVYRRRLKEKKAPSREDFGRTALLLCLVIFDRQPRSAAGQWIYKNMIAELCRDGFDHFEVRKRFSDMLDKLPDYRKSRAWLRRLRHEREAGDAA